MIYAIIDLQRNFSKFYYSPDTRSDFSIIRINKILRKRVTIGFLSSLDKRFRYMGNRIYKLPKEEEGQIESIYQRIKDDNNYIKYKK